MLKNAGSKNSADDDVTPEGVTEELDVAYINRQGASPGDTALESKVMSTLV